MDPFLASLVEFWWVAPTAVGAVAAGAVGVRLRHRSTGRMLGLKAAQEDLRTAQKDIVTRRTAVKVARAEHARSIAERGAARASVDDVAGSKQALRRAEREVKAAGAAVKSARARITAARAELHGDRLPLDRLRDAHDAVTARWMTYETDPARLIAFPAMSDVRDPATAAFLAAAGEANRLRPAPDARRLGTEDFRAYRDAVSALERAFDTAERSAHIRAGAGDPAAAPPVWQETAQHVISQSADALGRAAGAAASAFAAWSAKEKNPRTDDGEAR